MFDSPLPVSPPNDNFANATVITSLPFSDSVDNTGATTEPDEPQYCAYSPQTVWYKFTPTANAVVRADMAGSSFGVWSWNLRARALASQIPGIKAISPEFGRRTPTRVGENILTPLISGIYPIYADMRNIIYIINRCG